MTPELTTLTPPRRSTRPAFPLATLVARLMTAIWLLLTALTAGPWLFTRGSDVAFGVVVGSLPQLLVLVAFALLLPKGNRWVAAAFGFWCAWGFISALSGTSDAISTLFGYAYAALNFIGIAGVFQDFRTKAIP